MKIMAVDDDVISLDLLSECLGQGGYEHVSLLPSSSGVVQMLMDTAIAYDCILLDVDMPGKNGIDLCSEIRNLPRYRNTPIIMITKHNEHTAIERAFGNGATDYITKPFEFFEVITRIKVAERLVRERQAALDSYIRVKAGSRSERNLKLVSPATKARKAKEAEDASITTDEIMSQSVFQNYLEKATQTEDCSIDLIAIKVRKIDGIFAQASPEEFVSFLGNVADAVIREFGAEKTFLTHVGNGTFLCATSVPYTTTIEDMEKSVADRLAAGPLPLVCQNEIRPAVKVGRALTLKTNAKLNFNRASKAAIARLEYHEGALEGASVAS
ncbi:response regulator [Roseovarius aestuarii]|nr:response regulator [Roseovarius aestuarii]